uniref:Interferon c n=1 Tax=Oreochromis niloticus TaxID=8128 RepID=A0A669CAG9_ORENI|nr:interferon c [Oreochromis niloticus]
MAPSIILLILLPLFGLQMMLVAKPTPQCCPLTGNVVKEAHHLLKTMGEPKFPLHCRPVNANISFPDSTLPTTAANRSQCPRVLWVVYKSLEGMWLTYEEHELPVGDGGVNWDEKKLDDFFNLQYRLQDEGRCLPSDVEASGLLSSYFSNVTAVIEQQDSAACGWEALRRDVIWVLKSTQQIHRSCFNLSHAHCKNH